MTLRRVLLLIGAAAALMVAFAILTSVDRLAEVCRAINVPLGVAVAAGFFVIINDAWHRYGLGGRVARAGLFLVLFVVAAGSAEALVRHAQLGVRSAVMTLALVVTGIGLVLIPHDGADR